MRSPRLRKPIHAHHEHVHCARQHTYAWMMRNSIELVFCEPDLRSPNSNYRYLAEPGGRRVLPKSPTQPTPDPHAAIQTDPRKLLDAANSASGAARNAWLAFLFIMAYLAVTLAGVSHKDLVLNTPTNLPFVQVSIPLKAFFSFAPFVLLFAHFGMLVQHRMLYDKLNQLKCSLPNNLDPHGSDLRDEIHSYFFTQSVIGKPVDIWMSTAFRFMLVSTFILTPFLLFFYFQTQFLPYHDEGITWLHRIVLLVDVIILVRIGWFLGNVRRYSDWSFIGAFGNWLYSRLVHRPYRVLTSQSWRYISHKSLRGLIFLESNIKHLMRILTRGAACLFGALAHVTHYWISSNPIVAPVLAFTLAVSWFVATVPDSRMDRHVLAGAQAMNRYFGSSSFTYRVPVRCDGQKQEHGRQVFAPTAVLFERKTSTQVGSWGCLLGNALGGNRNLNVADVDFVKEKNRRDGEVTHSLRGRDFRFANFDRADLQQVDFDDAILSDARLDEANLTGARFRRARLQGANLVGAELQGADLRGAELQGANLWRARLQGANLRGGKLQGVNLGRAKLQGANLRQAELQDANLLEARLQVADLREGKLQGASLGGAELQGASLGGAELQGANLGVAKLQGANLRRARLQGANLVGAELQGADFEGAKLQGASIRLAELQGANLGVAKLQGADIRVAELQGADLRGAELQGADLRGAKLQGANLQEAELQGADLRRAKLQGANLRGANIWATSSPGRRPAELANYRDIRVSRPGAGALKRLSGRVNSLEKLKAAMYKYQAAGHERISTALEQVKRRLQPVLKSSGSSEAEKKNEEEWRQLREQASLPDPKKLADFLAKLACSDNTDKGYMAQRLIGRGIQIAPLAFYTKFIACDLRKALRKRIPEALLSELERAAEQAKVKRKPAAVLLEPTSKTKEK